MRKAARVRQLALVVGVAVAMTACGGPSAYPGPGGDVDCEGGSGNGPRYVGAVEVSGADPYDLDRDGDGIGCE